jgi:hypothetical protein
MTCGRQLINEVRKLSGLSGHTPKTAAVSVAGGIDLAVDALSVDSMSCSLREIRMRVPGLNDAGVDVLKKWANDLCARVTYLLEQLGPLEIDTHGKQVLIRSTSPDQRDDAKSFYEVLLQSQGAGLFTLRRYRRDKTNNSREHVELRTTLELLEKLADDLVATVPAATH